MANTVPNNSNNNGDERKKHGKNNKVNKGTNYEELHIAVCQNKRTNSNQSLGRWCGERERVVGEVRAINTKRPRQQLSSRAKISKVKREGETERKSGRDWEREQHHHPWQLCCWQHSLEKVAVVRGGRGTDAGVVWADW